MSSVRLLQNVQMTGNTEMELAYLCISTAPPLLILLHFYPHSLPHFPWLSLSFFFFRIEAIGGAIARSPGQLNKLLLCVCVCVCALSGDLSESVTEMG